MAAGAATEIEGGAGVNAGKGKKLVDFLKWALHDGEKEAATLDYAPLPANIVTMLDKRLSSVKNVASAGK